MNLHYHRGKNFGDALNPIIFNHYLKLTPENNLRKDIVILGIGSILGLYKPSSSIKKVFVFSSGYAKGLKSTYGSLEHIDDRYDFICVRGKSTAKELNIDHNKAVCDGAILLPLIKPLPHNEKVFEFSYMPHVGSLDLFDKWQSILKTINIHLIDPRKPVNDIIIELSKTKTLLTEAMHGAIIADAYQIPWIPIKTVKTINDFKWIDYLNTVNQKFNPNPIKTLYSKKIISGIVKNKLKKLNFIEPIFTFFYSVYQSVIIIPKVKRNFKRYTLISPSCCDSIILKSKQLELIELFKELEVKINAYN